MTGASSLEAVKRKIKFLQDQADSAEEKSERLQRELLAERSIREKVSVRYYYLMATQHVDELSAVPRVQPPGATRSRLLRLFARAEQTVALFLAFTPRDEHIKPTVAGSKQVLVHVGVCGKLSLERALLEGGGATACVKVALLVVEACGATRKTA